MTPIHKFRYTWIKVTDREGRKAASVEKDELIQRLSQELESAPPDSDYRKALSARHATALRLFGPTVLTMTLHIRPIKPGFSVDFVLTDIVGAQAGDLEISTVEMPEGYTAEQSLEWIKSDIGATWSHRALMCQLSYAVGSLLLE